MASVLVYTELAGGGLAPASLQALGEGRRIASALGATLYAFVADPEPAGSSSDALVADLGRHGADKVILAAGPEFAGPPLWATHGPAAVAAFELRSPLLVLMAATPGGRDIAPRLAAHVGAAFVAEPSIECGPRGEIVLSRVVYASTYRRRLAADDLGRAVVATLTPGSYPLAAGSDDADVIVLEPPARAASPIEQTDWSADPADRLDSARVIVTAGAGVDGPATFALVADLAAALGGELAATRAACERGLAPPGREVGVGARHVAPRLYVACGASGSGDHLGAVSSDAEIVAINSDPDAPIFRIATYGIVGSLAEVLPELITAVRSGRPPVEPP